ncbi:peptidoglycan editing factor PgeF [Nitrospirillum sp. BR 11752]|uniref:peptidoglycan editing factor PgeF n=1 Tax=Nitrospirillum sp. BR 11752 TaxID=3104293 RepID=UPI002EC77F75|nr:peptidoglycan editing factor PgeF [Nitrospirillum sp. BR 11752]
MTVPIPADRPHLTLDALDLPGVRHGYFTRRDGVSTGLYAGRNVGFGSNDDAAAVAENRARCAADLGLGPESLVTVYQVHSPTVVTVERPWAREDAPQADALVTRQRGIALGILTADCVPVLFADSTAGVVGAAHAGWKGAFTGVLEATVQAMAALGADPARIVAGVGPHIGPDSYEVGPEFEARFLEADGANQRFFRPGPQADHPLFDIGGYVGHRLAGCGLAQVSHTGHDTVAEESLFFSYRRCTLRREGDYGRHISMIALSPTP